MDSKELVLRAMERSRPPRVPIHYSNRDFDSSDTFCLGYHPAATFVASGPGMTEWGYVWEKLDATMGQPRTHPLADWDRLATYTPPDAYAPGRLEHVAAEAAKHAGKFIAFDMGITGFNIATFLRGFETYLMDLTIERERAERVMDMVTAFENGVIKQLAGGPVACLRFGDDWGSQNGLMINPSVWREVFWPRYKAQFELAHRCGMKIWFHTCGNVFSIIGDLITAGADVIELLQPDVMGIERLAETYGGKVCFCCSVDHQRRAIAGTSDEIFAYARLLQEKLGGSNGAYIGYVEDYSSLGMSEQNYQWIRQAFHSLPPYNWT